MPCTEPFSAPPESSRTPTSESECRRKRGEALRATTLAAQGCWGLRECVRVLCERERERRRQRGCERFVRFRKATLARRKAKSCEPFRLRHEARILGSATGDPREMSGVSWREQERKSRTLTRSTFQLSQASRQGRVQKVRRRDGQGEARGDCRPGQKFNPDDRKDVPCLRAVRPETRVCPS